MITIAIDVTENDREKFGGINIAGKSSHIFIIVQIRSALSTNKETFCLRA